MGTAMMKSASTLGVQLLQNGKQFPTATNLLTRAAESLAANSVAHHIQTHFRWRGGGGREKEREREGTDERGEGAAYDILYKYNRNGTPNFLPVGRQH
jgi:hypothetical protein